MRTVLALAATAFAVACGPRATTNSTPAPDRTLTAEAGSAEADAPRGMGRMRRGQGMGPGQGMRAREGRGMGMGMGAGMAHDAEPIPEPTDPLLLEGKEVFDGVCYACHTLQPPPKLAPPMQMVSMHLRETFATEGEAAAHIVGYVAAPQAESSVMPEHAVERFGLMPAQPLPAETLRKVAAYVWWLTDPDR